MSGGLCPHPHEHRPLIQREIILIRVFPLPDPLCCRGHRAFHHRLEHSALHGLEHLVATDDARQLTEWDAALPVAVAARRVALAVCLSNLGLLPTSLHCFCLQEH